MNLVDLFIVSFQFNVLEKYVCTFRSCGISLEYSRDSRPSFRMNESDTYAFCRGNAQDRIRVGRYFFFFFFEKEAGSRKFLFTNPRVVIRFNLDIQFFSRMVIVERVFPPIKLITIFQSQPEGLILKDYTDAQFKDFVILVTSLLLLLLP